VHFAPPAPAGQPTAAIQRVELGPRAVIVAGPPRERPPAYTVTTVDPSGATSLDLSPGTAIVYYVQPPRRGRLRLDVRGRGSLRVRVSSDADHREGRPPGALLEEPLRPTGAQHELDLSGYGGAPLRLEVAVGGAGEGAAPRSARSRSWPPLDPRRPPQPQAPRPLHRRRRGRPPRRPPRRPAPRPPLRRRRAPHPVGPRVRPRLRQRALGRAQPQRPAVRHDPAGARDRARHPRRRRLSILLPELLDRAGYHGLVVAANADVSGDRGLTQGFDASVTLSRGTGAGNDGRAVIAAALAGPGAPRFVYADHGRSAGPLRSAARAARRPARPPEGAPLPHLTHLWLGRVRTGAVVPDAAQRDYLRRLYRGELQRRRRGARRSARALEQTGSLDEAIVVLVGVHGEEFFEHGGVGHGHTLHEESLRVPAGDPRPRLCWRPAGSAPRSTSSISRPPSPICSACRSPRPGRATASSP
jgi:hypothetical protein